jgi:hypothetical protein
LSKGWGAVFEDYTLPYFPALDAAVAITLGSCAGVAEGPNVPRRTCIIALSFACTASLAHFFVLLYYRPCLVRATQWFVSIGSGLTLGSACLSFAFYMGREFDYQNITEKLMLSQSLVGVLLMVIGVGYTLMVFIDFFDAVTAGRELRHLEKTTKEQLALYEGVNKNLNNNNNDHHSNLPKRSALDEELAILVNAMRPENEKKSAMTRIVDIPNDDQEMMTRTKSSSNNSPNLRDLTASPKKSSKRRVGDNFSDYSEHEEEYDDDYDDDAALVHQYLFSTAKTENERRRELEEQRKLEKLRKQKSRLDDDASAKAMIEYSKRKIQEEEEKKAKLEHQQKFSALKNRAAAIIQDAKNVENNNNNNNNVFNEEETTTVKTVPQFHNKSVTTAQAKKLSEILHQADEKKRKMQEERNLEILRQQEEKIKKEQEIIERRKRLAERMKNLPSLDSSSSSYNDNEEKDENERSSLLDEAEELEVDDILGRL